MALIQWNNGLSVNVAEIDGQHQKLIQMINELHDAMRQGKGKEALGKIVDGLIAYTQTHFKTEEHYFAKFNYGETQSHKKEHADFVKKAADFRDGFQKGQLGLSVEVMTFLSHWLTNHIQGIDKKYTPLFNQQGLK